MQVLTMRFRKWITANSIQSFDAIQSSIFFGVFWDSQAVPFLCILGYLTSTIWPSRHAAQFITIGHFDAIPGELRLKAYGTRIMISFLAVCLRSLCEQLDASQQTDELRLCSLMMTQLSNWNLDLENCPIDLTEEQAERLYATGMEHPAMHSFRVFLVISTPKHPALVYIYYI